VENTAPVQIDAPLLHVSLDRVFCRDSEELNRLSRGSGDLYYYDEIL